MLYIEKALKDMAAEAIDAVNSEKTIRAAIYNPVFEMARQMREEDERMQAIPPFADTGIAESVRMLEIANEAKSALERSGAAEACAAITEHQKLPLLAIADEAESALKRSGAEEAFAAITEQQKLSQLAIPDPNLVEYLISGSPQCVVDQQAIRIAEMTDLAPNVDLINLLGADHATNTLLQESIAATTGVDFAIHFGNVYASVVESYAADNTISQLRDVERMVRRWQPTETAASHARSPRQEDADRTAPNTTSATTGNQPAKEASTETASDLDSGPAILDVRPQKATVHGFTIVFAVESATRLFVARQFAEAQLGINSVCALIDGAMSADERMKKGGLAQRWIHDPEPQSVLEALEFTFLRELIALVTHDDMSAVFNLNPPDRKLLKTSLFKINTLRNQVSHCRGVADADALLTELKELAAVVLRLIRCPLHVESLLYDIRDTSVSRTLH